MSLHEKAILIDLTLSSITTAKTDPTITKDVLASNSADADAGRWVSQLWPKEALDTITAHDRATRAYHKEMTLPWLEKSKRILPSSRFADYMDTVRQRKAERAGHVTDFINRYDYWIQEASAMRQGTFRQADYPDRSTAESRFDFKVESEPVPHKDDFRVTLAAPDMEAMQDTLEQRLAAGVQIARNDILRRITEPLAHMVERLAEPGATFRDSLFENVRQIARMIPALNITDDPDIEAVRSTIISRLDGLDPSIVRDSAFERKRTAAAANDILSTMAPWLEETETHPAAA
jgi:hypothetical protein